MLTLGVETFTFFSFYPSSYFSFLFVQPVEISFLSLLCYLNVCSLKDTFKCLLITIFVNTPPPPKPSHWEIIMKYNCVTINRSKSRAQIIQKYSYFIRTQQYGQCQYSRSILGHATWSSIV